ncbi:nucleoside hydrolase-like [Sitodiplosis mosellana]|uniref:nucleoside hydrolase-like n=1 Tax=Sitodiplosis mosellana TaxID=263140 RepID=UPI0024451732|nr:nucleoside hydrolase-like [Sitodiplosis mosellana]
MQNPHEISLICVGPLTNIGVAIKAHPEIKENIKEVFIMGGNSKGRGNSLKGAEFNFYKDPEAAHIVLNSLNCPITILPLECGREESISITLDWRFDVLGNVDCRNVQLLNEVERIAFRNQQLYDPFDALLVAIFLHPEKCIRAKYSYNATVELQGHHTRGQMIFDRRSNKHNVSVIELLHGDEIKKLLQWTATA